MYQIYAKCTVFLQLTSPCIDFNLKLLHVAAQSHSHDQAFFFLFFLRMVVLLFSYQSDSLLTVSTVLNHNNQDSQPWRSRRWKCIYAHHNGSVDLAMWQYPLKHPLVTVQGAAWTLDLLMSLDHEARGFETWCNGAVPLRPYQPWFHGACPLVITRIDMEQWMVRAKVT